jgi:uncharacterized protein Yka (UPF0111/DUF47 family)
VRLFGGASADPRFFELFNDAGQNVERTAALLRELVTDYPDRADLAREIRDCERHGDRIAHDIIHLLNTGSGRPPFPAGQVHALARTLDDIVDHAEETADIMGLYSIEAPMTQAEELAEVLVHATAAVARALRSFSEGSHLSDLLIEIHRLENEGDRVSREAIASLFAGGIDPMVVIRWKDVFESLERAIDSCESVAHLLEGASLRAQQS